MQKVFHTTLVSVFCTLILSIALLSQNARSDDAESFTRVIDKVLHKTGIDTALNPHFCQPLGLARNSEQRCPTKQDHVLFGTGTGSDRYPAKMIDVGTDAVSGQARVVIWDEFKTDAGLQATFYVTSVSGDLEEALDINSASQKFSEIPINSAIKLDFEKERAFWVQRLGGP